jgi:uncharacterized protein
MTLRQLLTKLNMEKHIKTLVFLLVLIALGVAALFVFQSKLLFYPTVIDKKYIFKFDIPFEEKFIKYGDGKEIHGLLFKPTQPVARILYFHGNGGALDSWGYLGAELSKQLNSEVLIVDYPGFGKSSSGLASSEVELYESAEAAIKILQSNVDAPLPIILYGRSLGSGIASYLSNKIAVQALILETPYLSLKAMAEVVFPLVPTFLVRYDLDNQKNIKKLKIPILIIHGTADTLIPFSHAQQLANESKQSSFIIIDGGGHNNLPDYPQYWVALKKFTEPLTQKN